MSFIDFAEVKARGFTLREFAASDRRPQPRSPGNRRDSTVEPRGAGRPVQAAMATRSTGILMVQTVP
jgi:hypothetical protein